MFAKQYALQESRKGKELLNKAHVSDNMLVTPS
jgi:hypothetical protein